MLVIFTAPAAFAQTGGSSPGSTPTTTELKLPFTGNAGTATSNKPILDLTQTWKGGDYGISFTAIKVNIIDLVSHVGASKLLDMQINGKSVFTVGKNGNFTLANQSGTSQGGIRVAGNNGEMALTSQIHPSGQPGDVFRYYWESGSAVGSVAVLRGMGTNRLSIESAGAMVHIAQNSRYEWEGLGSPTIDFIGYEAGSSRGKSINITNTGQTIERAVPLVVTNVQATVDSILTLRDATVANTTINRMAFRTGGGIVQTMAPGQAAFVSRGYSLTGANSAPMLDFAGAWNTTAGPTAFLVDITDVNSALSALLMNLKVNGQSLFSVSKGGDLAASTVSISNARALNHEAAPLLVTNVQPDADDILTLRDGTDPNNVVERWRFTTGGGLVQTMSANQSAFVSRGYSLAGANSASMFDLAGTWNTSGAPSALLIDITDLNSALNARLLDLRVNGQGVFTVSKGGDLSASTVAIANGQTSDTDAPPLLVTNTQADADSILVLRDGTDPNNIVDRFDFTTGGGLVQTVGPDQTAYFSRGYSLTGSDAAAMFDLAGTWNTSGAPSAFLLDITDLNSAINALLVDLRVNGQGVFAVSKGGDVVASSVAISNGQTSDPDAAPLVVTNTQADADSVLVLRDGTDPNNIVDRFDFTTGGGLIQTVGLDQSAYVSRGYYLTGANSAAMLDFAGTWDTSGAPTAFLVDITDLNSAFESLLMDLRVSGQSVFSVSKGGLITASSMVLTDLQTSDPEVAGQVWNDAGVLRISEGPAAGPDGFSSFMAFAAPMEDVGEDDGSSIVTAATDEETAAALNLLSATVETRFASLGGVGNATGTDSVALGTNSTASGAQASALGNGSTASASRSTAIGQGASATAQNSVALGAGSVASMPNTVSLGSPGNERRLTNMADGIDDSDGATYRQVRAAYAGVALGLAMSSVSLNLEPGEQGIIIGVGTFEGVDALALKYEAQAFDGATFGAGFGVSDGRFGGSAGVGFKW